jgi:hypothetical protein
MKVIDAGHKYALVHLDGSGEEILTFVKREGPGFPGNVGSYPGTNLQEVLRACIDRVKYLDGQVPSFHNKRILSHLRDCLRLLEERAADRHGRDKDGRMYDPYFRTNDQIEHLPTCSVCGHIGCFEVGR